MNWSIPLDCQKIHWTWHRSKIPLYFILVPTRLVALPIVLAPTRIRLAGSSWPLSKWTTKVAPADPLYQSGSCPTRHGGKNLHHLTSNAASTSCTGCPLVFALGTAAIEVSMVVLALMSVAVSDASANIRWAQALCLDCRCSHPSAQ